MRPELGRLGFADIAAGVNDHAGNITNYTETIFANGIDNQTRTRRELCVLREKEMKKNDVRMRLSMECEKAPPSDQDSLCL